MNKIKVFEAFSGYGSQSIALKNLGIPYEVVAISEIDKYAIKAYEAIHGPTLNLGDITQINVKDIPEHDLFTYSFPCQDISVAGKTRGIIEGETRSGLLYECKKIIEYCKPKYLLLENVKNLVGKKFKSQFDEWLEYLESLGYTSYWKVLNAKDYGVPQNRERVFVVSILNDTQGYEFPEPFKLNKCIKDILEDEVDEKYYINKPFNLVNKGHQAELDMKGQECIRRVYGVDKIAPTLTTMQGGYREPKILCEGNVNPSGKGMNGNVFNSEGLSPTLTTNKGEGPKILIPQATKKGYIEMELPGVCDLSYPNSKTRRGRVQDGGKISPTLTAANQDICYIDLPCIAASRGRNPNNPSSRVAGEPTEQRLELNTKGTSNTITTVQKDNYVVEQTYRIRKLTPRECFRLMGMNDYDIDKIQQAGISNTQQYKLAGNSIVVNVLEAIFKKLFLQGEYNEQIQRNI